MNFSFSSSSSSSSSISSMRFGLILVFLLLVKVDLSTFYSSKSDKRSGTARETRFLSMSSIFLYA